MQVERLGIAKDAAQVAALNPVKAKAVEPQQVTNGQSDLVVALANQQRESRSAQTEQRLETEKASLQRELDKANEQLNVNMSSIRFKMDESTGRSVVTIYDMATEEVIRQLPSEDALSNAQRISEFLSQSKMTKSDVSGLLFDEKA